MTSAIVGRKADCTYIAMEGGSPRSSPDHLVGLEEGHWSNRQAQGFGCLEVDDQVELGPLYREVGRLGTLQDLVHKGGRALAQFAGVRPIGQQASRLGHLAPPRHGRQV